MNTTLVTAAEDSDARRAQSIRFTSNIVGPIYFLADVICLAAAVPVSLFAYQYVFGTGLVPSVHVFAFAIMTASYLLIRSSKRVYRRTLADTFQSEDFVIDAIVASLLTSALVWQFGLIENYSRGVSVFYLLSLVLSLAVSRPLIRIMLDYLAARGAIQQRIVFYGADLDSVSMMRRLIDALDLPHIRYMGVADDRPRVTDIDGMKFLGGYKELTASARRGEIDQVLICVPKLPPERLHEIVEGLSAVSVDVSLVPAEAIELAPDYRVQLLGSLPVLNLWQRPFRDMNTFVKRGEDLLFGGIALILLAPIMVLAALLIRLTSHGPILFVQPRIGFNNEIIEVLKFRTMYADRTDVGARATTTRNDPRVTSVGRFLRKFSIDELPQLLNVMTGEMSLVGPRPHALEMKVGDRFYQDAVRGYAGRHRVRPGITGLAQVKGLRGEIRTVERAKRRVELDKEYIERWTLWLDLRIILATVRAVFFDSDAY